MALRETRHSNLQNLYAYKLLPRKGGSYPKLCLLMDPSCDITLKDMLDACGRLSTEKAVVCCIPISQDHNIRYFRTLCDKSSLAS
jgi:hypothetical protein